MGLGVSASIVTMRSFLIRGREFGIWWFLGCSLVLISTLLPFIADRYHQTLGLSPIAFTMVAIVSYVVFSAVSGVLIGGVFTSVMRVVGGTGTPQR
jgi:hypothetical protein